MDYIEIFAQGRTLDNFNLYGDEKFHFVPTHR